MGEYKHTPGPWEVVYHSRPTVEAVNASCAKTDERRGKAMSDTPRTDEVQKACNALGYGSMVVVPEEYPPHDPWELSRILERENNEIIKHNRALIEALEAVEWQTKWKGVFSWDECPCCGNFKKYDHMPSCKLDNALKQARGEK